MNPISRTPSGTVRTVVRCIALATPLLLMAASQAEASTPCADARVLDVRLNSLATQGVTPLVQFVHRTQAIYQIDVAEALERVAAYRHNAAACRSTTDQ